MTTITCPRCEGQKTLDQFLRVEYGRCFRCGGSGQVKAAPPSDRMAVSVGPDGARYKRLTQEQAGAFLAAGRWPADYCGAGLTVRVRAGGDYRLEIDLYAHDDIPGEVVHMGRSAVDFRGRPGGWEIVNISHTIEKYISKREALGALNQICRA
jgi:hypothetical protein